MYAINNKAANYVKQELVELRGEMNKSTIAVGDYNTLLNISLNKQQKSSKDIELFKSSNRIY